MKTLEADEYLKTHSVKDILNDLFVAYLFENISIEKYIELSDMVKSYAKKPNYYKCYFFINQQKYYDRF